MIPTKTEANGWMQMQLSAAVSGGTNVKHSGFSLINVCAPQIIDWVLLFFQLRLFVKGLIKSYGSPLAGSSCVCGVKSSERT